MATMYNPPHLGELIRESVEAEGWSVTETARRLGMGRVALSRVLNGHAGVSAAAGAGADWLERRRTLDADAGHLRSSPGATEAGGRGRLTGEARHESDRLTEQPPGGYYPLSALRGALRVVRGAAGCAASAW